MIHLAGVAKTDLQYRFPEAGMTTVSLPDSTGGRPSRGSKIVQGLLPAVVRIQADRGQTVVTSGPYRFVRHPGCAGGMLTWLAAPLALGSLWGLLPAVLTAIALVIRTIFEDRMLLAGLPGYAEYAQRTRARLLPGVW